MIPEDGTGLPTADTYVDPTSAFAVSYMASRLYSEAWTAATAPDKEAATIQATRTLDGFYDWKGYRLNDVQALGWPRTGVVVDGVTAPALPVPIKQATLELAVAMLERNRTSDTASGSQALDKLELGKGAVVLEFGTDPAAAPIDPANIIPPYVARMLSRYVATGTGGMMRPIERR